MGNWAIIEEPYIQAVPCISSSPPLPIPHQAPSPESTSIAAYNTIAIPGVVVTSSAPRLGSKLRPDFTNQTPIAMEITAKRRIVKSNKGASAV